MWHERIKLGKVGILLLGIGAGCEASQPEASQVPVAARASVASGLRAEAECSRAEPDKGVAQLSWTPSAGSPQRVEVTIYADGFDNGRLETSEPLREGQSSLTWNQLHGQAFHFWRVLTLQGTQWVPSEVARFEGPTCVASRAEERP